MVDSLRLPYTNTEAHTHSHLSLTHPHARNVSSEHAMTEHTNTQYIHRHYCTEYKGLKSLQADCECAHRKCMCGAHLTNRMYVPSVEENISRF